MVRKYNTSGTPVAGPVQVNVLPTPIPTPPGPVPQAHTVALAVDPSDRLIATWWEAASNGSMPETVYFRRLDNNLNAPDAGQTQVDSPPANPPGVKRAIYPAVATDTNGNIVVTWEANVNAADATSWCGMIKSFSSAEAVLKNDFRGDLNGRSPQGPLRVARSSQAKKLVYAWRNSRAGYFDVYTRLVPSLP